MNAKNNKRRVMPWVLALVVGATGSLTGCEMLGLDGGGDKPAEQPAADGKAKTPKKKKAEAKAEKKAEEKEYERPSYPDLVRRNPFQPKAEIISPKVNVKDDDSSDKTPLKEYGINQLKLVAIISEVVIPKAMFIDPKGVGHLFKEGDVFSSNSVEIVDIRDNEVAIQESAPEDSENGSRPPRIIALATDEVTISREDELSDDERDALKKLLGSKEGRDKLRETLSDDNGTGSQRRGIAPPK